METYKKTRIRRPAWVLLAGTSALLLTACLSLLLSHFQALAQPVADVTEASLVVHKDVNTAQAEPGDVLTYTITVLNTGGDPVYVWLTDTLPAELTYATGMAATVGTFGVENGVITWSHTLGEQACITFSAEISSEITYANIENTARVIGTGELITDSAETEIQVAETDFYQHLPIISLDYPPRPELNDIPAPGANNSYTVSWSSVSGADWYVLQEATDADFNSVTQVYTPTGNSQLIEKGTAHGTLYYRVRADDDDRWGQGPWSDVKSVTLQVNYYDSFDDASSGWDTHTAKCCLSDCDEPREHLDYKYNLYYESGRYHVYIPTNCYEGGNHGYTRHLYPVSLAPGIERPSSQTCIEMRGSFEKPQWVSSWGLVLAASNDRSTNYSFWVDDRGDWGVTKIIGYQYPGPNHSYWNEDRIEIIEPMGGPRWPAHSGSTPNTLRVEISGDRVKLYMNGEYVDSFRDGEVASLRWIGIIGGNWEWGDTQIGYDYFFVDEGCDTY